MKKILLLIISLVLIPLVSGNWNMFMNDEEHTGFSDIDMKNINSIIWNVQLEGNIYSSPAIVENIIYVGTEKFLYALDLNGNVLWKKDMKIFGSSPTVIANRIYIGTRDGYIYCLNTDGDIIWDVKTEKEITASPLYYKGRIYIGSWDSNFYCIDADTGKIQWKYKAEMPVKSSASAWKDRIYVTFQNKFYKDELHCITSDGNLIWKYETSKLPEGSCPPVMSDQFITSSPTIYKDKVYFGSGEKKVYCIDPQTGELIWEFKTEETGLMMKYRTGEDRIISTLGAAYDMVYFGSWNNTVYALDANTGIEMWRCLTGDRIISSPAIADGMIYTGCMDGHFYSLEAFEGNLIGDFRLGKVVGSPSISNGYVFVPAESKLYCLGEKIQEKKELKTMPETKKQKTEEKSSDNKTYYIIGAVAGIIVLVAIGVKKR